MEVEFFLEVDYRFLRESPSHNMSDSVADPTTIIGHNAHRLLNFILRCFSNLLNVPLFSYNQLLTPPPASVASISLVTHALCISPRTPRQNNSTILCNLRQSQTTTAKIMLRLHPLALACLLLATTTSATEVHGSGDGVAPRTLLESSRRLSMVRKGCVGIYICREAPTDKCVSGSVRNSAVTWCTAQTGK